MKEEIDSSIKTVGDFNTSISIMDIAIIQRINKKAENCNIINHVDLTDIALNPTTSVNTFFSSTCRKFFRSKETSLNTFLKIEIKLNIVSHHNKIKLKPGKFTNHLEINTFLRDQWVNTEIIREIRIYSETNENKKPTYQNLWNGEKAVQEKGKFIVVNS